MVVGAILKELPDKTDGLKAEKDNELLIERLDETSAVFRHNKITEYRNSKKQTDKISQAVA